MITLVEIKRTIEQAERPYAFYDDDPDGLSSFLLLKKAFPKLEGMPVKGTPTLGEEFLARMEEHYPDLILVLDKAHISEEFRERAHTPIIWIDHHGVSDHKGTKYFNPCLEKEYNNESAPSVAYYCSEMLKPNAPLWIAAAGVYGDYHMFNDKTFLKKYRHLLPKKIDLHGILFNSKMGELVSLFSFILKGKTSDMKKSIRALLIIESPDEIFEQSSPEGRYLYERYQSIKKHYDIILNHALEQKTEAEPFIYIYPSVRYSFSADLSSHLVYLIKNEIVIVGRDKGDEIIFSIRSKKTNLQPIIKKALIGVNGYGGGHPHACGARLSKDSLNLFLTQFKEAIQNQKL